MEQLEVRSCTIEQLRLLAQHHLCLDVVLPHVLLVDVLVDLVASPLFLLAAEQWIISGHRCAEECDVEVQPLLSTFVDREAGLIPL